MRSVPPAGETAHRADLSTHRDVATVDLHAACAVRECAPAGAGDLEAGEDDAVARVRELVREVVQLLGADAAGGPDVTACRPMAMADSKVSRTKTSAPALASSRTTSGLRDSSAAMMGGSQLHSVTSGAFGSAPMSKA